MPFFKKTELDNKEKMKIIRRHEEKIKKALESMLKTRKELLLNSGYTEAQADTEIEELRDQLSREAIIFFNQQMRAATSVQAKPETHSLKHR